MKIKSYSKYKPSGVEWLGQVPEHWASMKFKHVFFEKTHTQNMNLPFGAISFGSVVYKENKANLTTELKENYQEVLQGEFLVNPLNLNYDLKSLRTALSKIDVVVSSGYFVLKLKNSSFDKRYLEYLLYIFDTRKMKTLGAGIRQTVTFKDMAVCDIVIPCPSEQTQIASFLDTETLRIDTLIAKQEKLINLLEEHRKSVISHAVTKGLDPNAKMKDSGVEWLGEVPEHWVLSKLKYEYSFSTGATPSTSNDSYFNNDYCWANISDLGKKVIFETKKGISSKGVAEFNMTPSKKGDLLFSFKLSIGQVSFVGCEMYTNEAIATFFENKKNSLKFAYYALPFYVTKKCSTNIYGAPLLNQQLIKNAIFIEIPLQEQIAIANYLDSETSRIDNLIAKQEKLIEKLKEYRSTIIFHAVTGKIDVRDFVVQKEVA